MALEGIIHDPSECHLHPLVNYDNNNILFEAILACSITLSIYPRSVLTTYFARLPFLLLMQQLCCMGAQIQVKHWILSDNVAFS